MLELKKNQLPYGLLASSFALPNWSHNYVLTKFPFLFDFWAADRFNKKKEQTYLNQLTFLMLL